MGCLCAVTGLALTTVRAETVTGRFLAVTMDGNLAEWTAGDRLYDDGEIADGQPLNSTYSAVYAANDATYLYFGLQLKAASSITSNWTHELYIDTDANPATGFNSGWMSGGYDRLIQYGSGGAVYSIYEFTGGASQGLWSWGFVNTFSYAFDGDVIEWALPRSALGNPTAPRILFHTGGGSVSIETWASSAEVNAKYYELVAAPQHTLAIQSLNGTANPAPGTYTNDFGVVLTNTVTLPTAAGGTQYVSLGWTMTGNEPSSGVGTGIVMTVTNDAVLSWLWQTNVYFASSEGAGGSVGAEPADGYYAYGTSLSITAVPANGYAFAGWSGDVAGSLTNDNPLTLPMNIARSITANFAIDYGRFGTFTLDGSLHEWQAGDVFYTDDDIADGVPLNSTYSEISVANDHEYLYVGMQLKGNSSIVSNWLHTLYIDSDNNPATGFNAGWMSGGYDRLVQYGSGGGTYSVYSFNGGTQATWSWNFISLIQYGFNNDVIEWGIPLSALGGSTAAKLEFQTGGGSVTVDTWAHHTESSAKIYHFAAIPTQTVQVISSPNAVTPSAGNHLYTYGTVITNTATQPSPVNGTQFVAAGWTIAGNDPVSGSGTNFTMTVTNDAVITWVWEPYVAFNRSVSGNGTITGSTGGYYAIDAEVTVTATPSDGRIFKGWSGDVPGGQTNDNPLTLTLDRARSITANFGAFEGSYGPLSVDGSLADWSGDAFYTDDEIVDGLPVNSTVSNIFIANDLTTLYVGLQYKAPSSISSNWVYNMFIDADLDPDTGFDGSGNWMANGYDYLVQYGANGAVYSVYSFAGATQGDWGWNFEGLISYAGGTSTAEWAIPLSYLGLSHIDSCKIQFQVTEGSITVETWAHHTEANAKVYELGSPPPPTLEVLSAYGSGSPAVGVHTNPYGTVVNAVMSDPAASGGTQYTVIGWTLAGNDPVSGSGSSFSMTHTNDATLTWTWQTNVQFTRTAGSGGSVSGDADGYYALGSSVTVTASPDGGYTFAGWTGDVPGPQSGDNPLTLTMDQARTIAAAFSQNTGRYVNVTVDGSMGEWQAADVFYNDAEITDGLPLNSSYSSISVANDDDDLFIGAVLKASSSILSNWTHELYIDIDMNPDTGFDSGWMSGGYDRLIQYGSGGSVYSVYEFTGAGQADWSWGYLGSIGYSFNNNIVEWSIPRAYLGGNPIIRLEFRVANGSVTVETWAHQAEVNAKPYAFATANGCPVGIRPLIVRTADQTVEANQSLSFDVYASDPGCVPPDITLAGKPAAASFSTSPSGTNQVGTFSWTPGPSDAGVHLLNFTAEDDEQYTTSFVMRVYVASVGESTNSSGVPVSQTNWAVSIADVDIPSSGNATLVWNAASGIAYDVYVSSGPFQSGMSWSMAASYHTASGSEEEMAMALSGNTNFVQVVPAGSTPTLNGAWGVIKPTIPSGYSMMSPPLRTDRSFSGTFGAELADALDAGTQVFIMHPGPEPSWTIMILNGSGNWVHDSGPAVTGLDPGQAFFIDNQGSLATPTVTGPVGNDGTQSIDLETGFNLLGVSEGRFVSAADAFETANPFGSYDFEAADEVNILNTDGSWRRLLRRPDGTWYDTGNPNSTGNTTMNLKPGQAYYYIRRGGATTLDF